MQWDGAHGEREEWLPHSVTLLSSQFIHCYCDLSTTPDSDHSYGDTYTPALLKILCPFLPADEMCGLLRGCWYHTVISPVALSKLL